MQLGIKAAIEFIENELNIFLSNADTRINHFEQHIGTTVVITVFHHFRPNINPSTIRRKLNRVSDEIP